MHFSTASLLSSLLVSTVGTGVFMYGKKSGNLVPMGLGFALMAFPYFVSNVIAIWLIAAMLVTPLFLARHSA